MSARGKRKDDEDHVSEGDAPPKKTFRKDSDETDEIVVCEISKNRRVMVRNWQGKIVVDIREFYVKDGKQMPGKKGISLSLDQWNVLRNHVDEIDKAVNENSLANGLVFGGNEDQRAGYISSWSKPIRPGGAHLSLYDNWVASFPNYMSRSKKNMEP
ncbi:RNA polymerase II transcriptional coactivator KIWI, partial [Cucurbita argyrosperma subsp. sororia]